MEDLNDSNGTSSSSSTNYVGTSSNNPIQVDISPSKVRHMSTVRDQIAREIYASVKHS
ncbi:hypothetical protein U1Q18_023299, partial [Sarracenia purpurea var. burkii]